MAQDSQYSIRKVVALPYETDLGESVVSAVDPNSMLAIVGDNPVVAEVSRDARQRLENAVAAIS